MYTINDTIRPGVRRIPKGNNEFYLRIEGDKALRIWKAIYKRRCWTERGCRWGWAEIETDTRRIYITTEHWVSCDYDLLDALRGRCAIYITVNH